MVITAHFVDSDWQLKKMIIGFKHVTDHKGATICKVLLECLDEWDIRRVFCITVDNATANSSTMTKFKKAMKLIGDDALVLKGEYMHLRCAAHILNLVVKKGMHEVNNSVDGIRNGVQYVRSSTNRLKSFDLRCDARRIKRGSLPLDVKTRWNSTYLMLEQAVKFRVAFEEMEAEDKPYNDYFEEKVDGTKRIGPPMADDWDAADRLIQILAIFYNSTMVLSGSTYVASHKLYSEIVNIARNLTPLNTDKKSDEELKKKALAMLGKLKKYWDPFGDQVEMNKLVMVASVFDPRKKMKFAELCFAKMYGTGACSQSQEQVETVVGNVLILEDIENLFDVIVKEICIHKSSNELDLYLNEVVETPQILKGIEYDVLSWWKLNSGKFPVLSLIAKDIFAMQVSFVASESAFSIGGVELRGCLVTIGVFGSGQDDGVIHNLSRGTEEIGSGTPGRLGSGTPSDSSRGDTLIPVYKRKMVWSSSSDPEADSTDRQIELYRGSDAESASREEDPSRFTAREDAIADVARDQDLPDDPEAMLSRRGVRPPAAGEAGVSCWPNAPEAPPLSIKAEEVHYDSDEAARLLQAKVQAAKGLRKRRRAKKTRKPDPPGSTLCTEDSLRDLKAQFGFSEGVELRLPTPNERADDPPEGFFTLYEGFFYHCYLWLPIPRPILAFLWSYKIALSQITTRGLRHLIGILVRSIETVNFVDLSHLRHLLEIRRIPGPVERFYISPRPNRRVIGGFPSKDEKYTDHFFFVALNEYSIHEDYLGRVVGTWRKIGIIPEAVLATLFYSKLLIDRFLVYADRNPSFLEDIPEGFLDLHDELIARKCDWTKHFSRDRIERALRLLHGAPCQSSSESSDHQLDHLIEMQGAAQSLRAKKAAERKAARERAILEANFRLPTPPEVVNDTEVAVGTEAIDEARESTALTGTEVSVDVLSTEVPEAAGTSVVVALSAEAKAKAKGKRPRGDSSGGRRKEKRSRNEAPIYKDKVASANLIASCSGPTLATPEALLEAERYRETAAGFLKALNSMNSMVRSYDSANRKCEISRAEADAKIAEANAKVVEADAKIAEADAKVAEADEARQGAEALAKAEKVERLKTAEDGLCLQRKFEAEIERLNRLFTEEKSLREKEVARERKAVKKEFAKKIEAIEAKMELYGKASERYMFLVQARANAELIAELEGGKKVEEEKEEVLQWKAEYGDAEDEFVRLGTELREGLKLPPASPDSVDDSFGNRSIEGVAAGVGILDQAGTNLGSEAARVPEEQDE
ncbi:hAT-like transposase RNase-H fold [Arabidopsis suecica]|uniref:HAT-like transposase RNase-H fold n=1 Tax=Arabidopsis suecica TaxID=45249 RepID=A0A8T2CIU3_ARASU|nr:hAT-like transposase RNase-H fold [Arabidopsis suecica]